MRILILLLSLLSCNLSFANQINYPTIWAVNDTVTNVKLNNNNNAVSAVVNGNIDNSNTAPGYSLYQTVSALPAAGTQGRVDFLTSDNSLNLDNGSSWLKTVTPIGAFTTGNIPVYNGGWNQLTPGALGLALVSNGVSSLPSYQQVPLSTGVTGNLSVNNLNSGSSASSSTFWRGDGTWAVVSNHGNQLFTSSGSFLVPSGVTTVYISGVGGGGGGGEAGGGGGAGGYILNFPYTVIPGNTYTITVGGGGAGSTGGGQGVTGSSTSFDVISIPGGAGGIDVGNGGAGGGGLNASTSVSTASISAGGGVLPGGNGAKGNGNPSGGSGGSPFGAGVAGTSTGVGNSAGNNTGAGGGGGSGGNNGGNGGSGILMLQY